MTENDNPRTLELKRVLAAPRAAIWRCWTEPDLLVRWFTPTPWRTIRAELDVRPGGTMHVVMQGPDGPEVPTSGVYLEVVPESRLVWTDAYSRAWIPAEEPFFTAAVTLADVSGGTEYRATAAHWTEDARKRHEDMGFHEGWGMAASQLEALAQSL
ncbi:MAG: SRPBCC family protein [Paracoccaceae bacterium]